MEIILGKTAGFCFGVSNAVNKTQQELNNRKEKLYCLGELTHNAQVMDKLEKQGLNVVESLEQVPPNSDLVIRTHGVTPKVYDDAKTRKINIVDFTCPKVLLIHKKAEEYVNNNYFIILIAERKHPETIGTIGFCGKNSYIVEEEADIKDALNELNISKCSKAVILSQTTFSAQRFEEIVSKIEECIPENIELKIEKTICNATKMRQDETLQIAKQVECMIIIGGKNSSNTKKLYNIAKENCDVSFWIQTKENLDMSEIIKYNKIGIMAGASTPKESIDDTIEAIKNNTEMYAI